MSRRHDPRGAIGRLGEWIHRNVISEGFAVGAAEADDLCRIASDLRMTCAEVTYAKRLVFSDGAVGHCECSACGWRIDDVDRYCRRCGAILVTTERGHG